MSEDEMAEQIRLMREHSVALDDVLERVRARGGPAAPWKVDLDRRSAELGQSFVVYFDALPDGGFSPKSYSRSDREPDRCRDATLFDDAIACIAEAISKAGPKWHQPRLR